MQGGHHGLKYCLAPAPGHAPSLHRQGQGQATQYVSFPCHAGGAWRHCQPMSALRLAVVNHGAYTTCPLR